MPLNCNRWKMTARKTALRQIIQDHIQYLIINHLQLATIVQNGNIEILPCPCPTLPTLVRIVHYGQNYFCQ
jgi:hypothetical protein